MKPFEYASAGSKEQAVALLGNDWNAAAVLAGGTDLLALMKDDVVAPKRLVNIKNVANLKYVKLDGNTMRIGALVTLADLSENADVVHRAPALAEALREAASPQIRNMATIGGNICQRPRCWYFRNGMGLLAKGPNGESLVLKGDNRYHAVLGNDGPAYFVSPSTVVPVLVSMGAHVRIVGPKGAREIPIQEFFRIPKAEGEREHQLQPNEVLSEVSFPVPAPTAHSGYYEVRQKEAFDWPMASCAVMLDMDGANVKGGRITLGQVAPVPWVSQEAAQAIVGKELNAQTADAAGQAAVSIAKPLSMNGYKVQLTRVAVKRALLQAVEGGRG